MPENEKASSKTSQGFDALYLGVEISSGGQRIHLPDLLEERARSELDSGHKSYSRVELDAKKVEMQSDIFVTMVAMYDICHAARVEVVFHDEHLFFRTEWLDGGLFLTYYIGGEFPGTYLYGPETHANRAYAENFRLQRDAAKTRIVFDGSMTEEDLVAHLGEMGCEQSIDVLREGKERRFDDFTGKLGK